MKNEKTKAAEFTRKEMIEDIQESEPMARTIDFDLVDYSILAELHEGL